jgi:hypothetical protein
MDYQPRVNDAQQATSANDKITNDTAIQPQDDVPSATGTVTPEDKATLSPITAVLSSRETSTPNDHDADQSTTPAIVLSQAESSADQVKTLNTRERSHSDAARLTIDYGRLLRPGTSDASSVRSLKWSPSLPKANTAKRRRSWSVSDAETSDAGQVSASSANNTALSEPKSMKRNGSIPPAAAASATATSGTTKSILVKHSVPSRRQSSSTIDGGTTSSITGCSSATSTPRTSISHQPTTLFSQPHVSDDSEVKFLKVSDDLTFRYHPNSPFGGPGRFGKVFLGVNIDNPTDIVAIKIPHQTEEESLNTMRRNGIFGYRKGHEARALSNILVMNYIAGLNPRELIEQGLLQTEEDIKKLAAKTQRALSQTVHRRGIAHGDIHAGNIRFRVEPRVPWWRRVLNKCGLLNSFKFISRKNNDTISRTDSMSSTSDSDGLMGFGFPLTPVTSQDGGFGFGLARFSTRGSVRTLMGARRSSYGSMGGLGATGTIEPDELAAGDDDQMRLSDFKLTPQFIDFGMARFLNELSPSEAAHAVEADRQRAYDAIWTQRHYLAKLKRIASASARQGNGHAPLGGP